MKNFQELIKQYEELNEKLDSYIWEIFHKYIEIKKILFSDPNHWGVDEESIYFEGYDGCMGCYDPKSITIPMKFFINPEKELPELKIQLEEKKKEEKEKIKKAHLAKERIDYERLKKKFEK